MSATLSPLYASPLSSLGASTELPEGYTVRTGRDEFGCSCYVLRHEHFGDLSDHDCYADAAYAAQDHADALADEASEADAAAADAAYEDALDRYHAQVKADAALIAAADPEARGRARAARALVAAIDGLSMQKVAA